MTPKISVVIPTYNNEATIADALSSVQNQTIADIEILVVDDNSSDGTGDIVQDVAKQDSRITYFKITPDDPEYNTKKFDRSGMNIDAGYSGVRYGWRRATAPWVTKQDGDDLSLLNRLEIQSQLAQQFDAVHVTTSCVWREDVYRNKRLDFDAFVADYPIEKHMHNSKQLATMAKESLGPLRVLPDMIYAHIPFIVKRNKYTRPLFFKQMTPYPGSGNNPLIRRDIVKKIEGRHRDLRRWPSLRGRGWDRDHNFRIALAHGKSVVIDVPLYAWDTPTQFDSPYNLKEYII